MTDYRYVGVADVVELSEEDFTRHDINDQGAVRFDESNEWTAALSDGAHAFLKSQGFPFMTKDEWNSFLEKRRADEAQAAADAEASAAAEPSDAALRQAQEAADLAAQGLASPRVIPARPGDDATRDELSDYAWTHYSVNAESPKRMTKAEINKALDNLGASDQDQTVDVIDVPGDTAGEGQMGDSHAATGDATKP